MSRMLTFSLEFNPRSHMPPPTTSSTVLRESQKDKPLFSEGICCTSRTASQYLFLSSSTFTSNNSPAPLGIVLGQPAAHLLLTKGDYVKSKHISLMPLLQSLPRVGSLSHPKGKTTANPKWEKAKGKGAKQTKSPLN